MKQTYKVLLLHIIKKNIYLSSLILRLSQQKKKKKKNLEFYLKNRPSNFSKNSQIKRPINEIKFDSWDPFFLQNKRLLILDISKLRKLGESFNSTLYSWKSSITSNI